MTGVLPPLYQIGRLAPRGNHPPRGRAVGGEGATPQRVMKNGPPPGVGHSCPPAGTRRAALHPPLTITSLQTRLPSPFSFEPCGEEAAGHVRMEWFVPWNIGRVPSRA